MRFARWASRLVNRQPRAEPMRVRSPDDWRRHFDPAAGTSGFGLSQVGWKDYRVPGPDGAPRQALSMLEFGELALLYGVARDRWTGRGEILDLGPYWGLTTWCLSQGVRDNTRASSASRAGRIHSYDLFVADDGSSADLLPYYLSLNEANRSYLQTYQGDVLTRQWLGEPVEIAFVDIAKSVELNDHVVSQFLSRLIDGAIVIQQDHIHYYHWWLHLFMEMFSDHFELIDIVYGATAVFRLTRPLPDLSGWSLDGAIPREERIALHRRHVERFPPSAQAVLWCAHAKLLLDHGDAAGARQVLDRVTPAPDRDPLKDFRAVTPGNIEGVRTFLAAA